MAADKSLVLRIFMVSIDAERSLLDQSAHQVEAGILIPSAARIKICVGNESHRDDQQGTLPGGMGTDWRRRIRSVDSEFGIRYQEASKII